ncbi:MAG: hypothetical protein V1790_07145 [Planctomycetota bacterium]
MVRDNRLGSSGLRDLVGVLAVSVLSVAFGIPVFAQWRHLSQREVCGLNLKGIGVAAKIYANDNGEKWPSPPFRRQAVDHEGIDYLAGDRVNDPPVEPGEVGYDRGVESTTETPLDPTGGSTVVSVTRALWLLVRSGDINEESFVCPSSGDSVRDADLLFPEDLYYDFGSYHNISYGYQVPFGPRDTRPREGADNRQAFAADKGPYYLNTFEPTFQTGSRHPVTFEDPQGRWRRYNSRNHQGQGQNVLFAAGNVAFADSPAVGVDGDNIYTVMTDGWDETGFNRIHGQSPHFATAGELPYPGQDAFGPGSGRFSTTDSLIYP